MWTFTTAFPSPYFNPRPPYGGRPFQVSSTLSPTLFQSTPPIRRATLRPRIHTQCTVLFQSTPPIRRATRQDRQDRRRTCHFNPRPPYGGRHFCTWHNQHIVRFQSTPPIRRATVRAAIMRPLRVFQSTPPIRRATFWYDASDMYTDFNPRPPYGGRQWMPHKYV